MRLEIDPHGDTLITIRDTDVKPSSPCGTGVEAPAEAPIGKQFLVSKKHLMLASRRASKVLGGSFKEATPEEDGLFHWKFEPIFDSKAFEIVMQIMHGQTRHVPEKVDVDLLAQIAAIVDDLECQDSVLFFAKHWLSQMKNAYVFGLFGDLPKWILISFVFEESEVFKNVTHTVIGGSIDVMPTFGLPIRPKILEDIDQQRTIVFAHLLDRLQGVQSSLLEQSLGCDQGCRAMMYGTLSQAMKSSSLLPLPLPPYTFLSIISTLRKLRAVKGVDYYHPSKDDTTQTDAVVWSVEIPAREKNVYSVRKTDERHPKLVRHYCRIEHHLKGLLDTTEGKIKGLKLSDYLST